MSQDKIQYTAIDAEQMRSFRAGATAALARRGIGFSVENWLQSIELGLVGAVGLLGLLVLDWSPAAALAALLLGVWANWCGDLIKYVLANRAVGRMSEDAAVDAQVWAVANALMEGDSRYRSDRVTRYHPGLALFVDLLFGGVATAVIVGVTGLFVPAVWVGILANPEWRWILLGLVWWQLMAAVWTAARHAWLGERAGSIRFGAGGRGIGLFLFMFPIVFMLDGKPGAAGGAMVIANLGLLLLAALSLFGSWLIQRETGWLRDWLRSERARAMRDV